jgi:beta-phosphoglucomutase-like phosphatase (HAD superfamily)
MRFACSLASLSAVITGDDVQRGRPDPECYLYSAQAIGAYTNTNTHKHTRIAHITRTHARTHARMHVLRARGSLLSLRSASGRPPARCIVIGNANACIEAAQEGGMKAVAVANRHAVYELSAADLVVRQLDELSIVNLKKLFATETPPDGAPQAMAEGQDEEEDGDGDDGGDDAMFGSRLF